MAMNKLFKGILQYKSTDSFTKEAGYIYFVREFVDGVATGNAEIWFGTRKYGNVEATRLAKIESDILALDGRVDAIEAALGEWKTLGENLETVAKVVAKHQERLNAHDTDIAIANTNASTAVATANTAKETADDAKEIAEGAVRDVTAQVQAAQAAQAAAESAKRDAETAKTGAEAAQAGAVVAQGAAEAAQSAAEGHASAAATSEENAGKAQAAAEAAKGVAEAAQAGAVVAQGAAESAQSAAEGHATAAATSEENAGKAQVAAEAAQAGAEGHASTAGEKASAAAQSASDAAAAKGDAETAKAGAVEAQGKSEAAQAAAEAAKGDAEKAQLAAETAKAGAEAAKKGAEDLLAEVSTANTSATAIANEAKGLAESAVETANDAKTIVDGLTIVKNASPSDTTVKEEYKFMSGEEQLGETIKIYKDSSIVSLELVDKDKDGNSGQFLKYTYLKADGSEDVVYVNVSDFLTQSEFGNGLTVSEAGVVSVLKDGASESYLSVSENGIKVSGIDAIKATADSAIQTTEGEYLYKNDDDNSINIKVCGDFENLTDDSDSSVADAYAVKTYVDTQISTNAIYYGGDDAE